MDILDFMEENYTSDLSIEEIAHYTGRSLATFKRDFKKISDLTPEKWLIARRLEKAYELIKGGRKRWWIYTPRLDFVIRHTSTAFKKRFESPRGNYAIIVTPSEIL